MRSSPETPGIRREPTANVIAQSVMTGVLAALIFSGIVVVAALDRPFTGAVSVSQESIRTVLEETQTAP